MLRQGSKRLLGKFENYRGRGENVVFEELYSKIEEVYGQVVMLVHCETEGHIQIQTHKDPHMPSTAAQAPAAAQGTQISMSPVAAWPWNTSMVSCVYLDPGHLLIPQEQQEPWTSTC